MTKLTVTAEPPQTQMEAPQAVRYCRREINGKLCMKPITKKNAHEWCPGCFSRLPFWLE